MLHGTDNSIAWKIVTTGFVSLSTLDAGWYGKGIYFSSSAKYIIPYYSSKKIPTIIISLVIPGNPYPVTEDPNSSESLIGAAPKEAYQSHYVLVNSNGLPPGKEIQNPLDELVIIQESQILPLFLLLPKNGSIMQLYEKWQREVIDPYVDEDIVQQKKVKISSIVEEYVEDKRSFDESSTYDHKSKSMTESSMTEKKKKKVINLREEELEYITETGEEGSELLYHQ